MNTMNRVYSFGRRDARLKTRDIRDRLERAPEAGRQGPAHGAHEIRDSVAFSQRLFRESRPRPVPESTIGLNSLRSAETEKRANDPGLVCLVALLRVHGIAAEAEQIHHRMGNRAVRIPEMIRCAKELGLKARASRTNWARLAKTPLPGIASLHDGGFIVLGKMAEDQVLVQRPFSPRPELMKRAEFEAIWDGRIILMARRASLSDLSRQFDITWFLGAVHKYRHLLTEVLVASFFLQIFSLVTPLFFQVVIDKVLVHRSMGTLEVLVIGLVEVSIFEAIIGALRTYVFAHTTNRIDVELGARLFRHLMALPIAYFQARRVG